MISEAVAKHGGFVMAHAAVIAEVLEPGELICPFVVVTKGENRQSIDFEAETQDEALDRAWSSLAEYRDHIDLWAMAREGLMPTDEGKSDVLVVSAWAHGMSEAIVFCQQFRPKAQSGFALVGPIIVQPKLSSEELEVVGKWFLEGIVQHPQGKRWHSWVVPNKPLEPTR